MPFYKTMLLKKKENTMTKETKIIVKTIKTAGTAYAVAVQKGFEHGVHEAAKGNNNAVNEVITALRPSSRQTFIVTFCSYTGQRVERGVVKGKVKDGIALDNIPNWEEKAPPKEAINFDENQLIKVIKSLINKAYKNELDFDKALKLAKAQEGVA